MLIRGLPRESATVREIQPDSQWSTDNELLALLAELVDQGNRLFVKVHSKKGSRPPDPLRIPRPSDARPERAALAPASTEDIKEFFAGAVIYEGGGDVRNEPDS